MHYVSLTMVMKRNEPYPLTVSFSPKFSYRPCLKMHLKKAKEKGFTQDEIDEAAWMGISFGGSPTMVFYEQLKNS